MARKFITYKNKDQELQLSFGNVQFHEDLLKQFPNTIERKDVLGGGWFHIDKELQIIILYGISVDFGSFQLYSTDEELIKACKESKFFTLFGNYTVYFSKKNKLEEIKLTILEDPKFTIE